MARTATGIDIGSSTAKLLRGEVKGNTFIVTDFAIAPNPAATFAGGWEALPRGHKLGLTRIGLTGRDVNVRYTRVPRVPDWQLRKLMHFEAAEIGDQSEAAVASDFNVLPDIPEIEGEDVVVLCMAREALLEEHAAGLAGVGGRLDAFTPNAIALYNAFLHFGVVMEDTVLVANLGRENLDVIVVRGTDLLFARNLSGGSKLFDEAVARRFDISLERAEAFKVDHCTLRTNTSFSDPNAEKGSRAMLGPAGQVLSLLQSTIMFCKSQVKLSSIKLDRVLLCGGGAGLDGLPEYIANGMSVSCEVFDPFESAAVVDTSRLAPEAAAALEDHHLEAVVALGLATSASDPEAYGIEILPASVRKRRDFVSGPLFLIAAAVLAVLYLGLYAWKKDAQLETLQARAGSLDVRYRRAQNTDQATQGLLAENADLAAYATDLFELAGSGEQLVRTLDALERHLPPDFWIESMSSDWGYDLDLDVPRADDLPILRVRGRLREGTDSPTLLFDEFVGGLRADLPAARIKEGLGGESFFTLALTLLAPTTDASAAGEPADDEDA